jgi:hypothetical protein
MNNQDMPYFKKQIITEQLIEELAEEGPKRSNEINALKNYGSKQDQYGLLRELQNLKIIKKNPVSHKKVFYELCLDDEAQDLIVEIRRSYRKYIEKLAVIQIPSQGDLNIAGQIQEIILWQIQKTLEFLQSVISHPSDNPYAQQTLTNFLHRKIDGLLELIRYSQKIDSTTTNRVLRLTVKLLEKERQSVSHVSKNNSQKRRKTRLAQKLIR